MPTNFVDTNRPGKYPRRSVFPNLGDNPPPTGAVVALLNFQERTAHRSPKLSGDRGRHRATRPTAFFPNQEKTHPIGGVQFLDTIALTNIRERQSAENSAHLRSPEYLGQLPGARPDLLKIEHVDQPDGIRRLGGVSANLRRGCPQILGHPLLRLQAAGALPTEFVASDRFLSFEEAVDVALALAGSAPTTSPSPAPAWLTSSMLAFPPPGCRLGYGNGAASRFAHIYFLGAAPAGPYKARDRTLLLRAASVTISLVMAKPLAATCGAGAALAK